MVQIDVSLLTDEQLAALALLDQEAAEAERHRRFAYSDLSALFGGLAQAGVDLEKTVGEMRGTEAVKAVKASKILEVIRRSLAYADRAGIDYAAPEVTHGPK